MDERLVWRQVTIPKGLSSLLSLISRETIVQKPECVYSFIAQLLEQEVEIRDRSAKGESNERTEETHLLAGAGDEGKLSSSELANKNEQPPPSPPSKVSVINEDVNNEDSRPGGGGGESPTQNVVPEKESSSSSPAQLPTSPQSDLYGPPSPSPSSPIFEDRAESAKIFLSSSASEGGGSGGGGSREKSRPASGKISSQLASPSKSESGRQSSAKSQEEPKLDEEEEVEGNLKSEQNDVEETLASDVEADELDLVEQLNTKELSDLLASGDFSSVSRSDERQDEDEGEEVEEEEEDEGDDDDVPKEEKEGDSEELRKAVVTIQSGFRGYQARKALKNRREAESSSADETANIVSPLRRPPSSGVTRRAGSGKIRNSAKYRSGMVMVENDSPLPEQLALDEQYLSQAATRIQANVRGFLTRRNIES